MQLRRCCRLAGGGGLLRSWRPGYVPSRRASTSDGVGAAVDALVTVASDAPPLTYSMSHGAMFVVEQFHSLAGIPYWEAVVCTTVCIRVLILPIAVQTIKNAARMAALQPDMKRVQEAMTADPNAQHDQVVRQRYMDEMQALFVRHKVHPLRALAMPLVQLPLFLSFYFALRDFATYFPAYASGGDFWFVNLSLADPYMLLPIYNALSFLAIVEIGSDGIQTQQQESVKWVMRGLALAILPLTAQLPSGLFVYWCANNSISILQTLLLKSKYLRVKLDIPDMPKVGDMTLARTDASMAVRTVDASAPPPPPPAELGHEGAPPQVTSAAPPREKPASQ